MNTFIVRRTHTSLCRQRHLTYAVQASSTEEAKAKLIYSQDQCNKRGSYVEQDEIISAIDGATAVVTQFPSPLVILGER